MSIEEEKGPKRPHEEPTSQQIADACSGTLSNEVCEGIAEEADIWDAVGLAYSALIETGVDDPDAFFIEKGIFLPQQNVSGDGTVEAVGDDTEARVTDTMENK